MRPSAVIRAILIAALAATSAWAPSVAQAAAAPGIGATWATGVTASSANLHAEVSPEGSPAFYRFEYLSEAAYEADGGGFAGSARMPAGSEAFLGSSSSSLEALQHVSGLAPATAYVYRIVATNGEGPSEGAAHRLRTEEVTPSFSLLDDRAWEMVSPAEKNGGSIAAPGQLHGGGDLQAAEGGGAVAFSSAASFAEGAGAPWASEYLSTRSSGGWSTQNVTLPTLAGAYGAEPEGVPYRLFSGSLGRAAVLDVRRCPEGEECPRAILLRDTATGALTSSPEGPGVRLEGATPDLAHLALSTESGLYEWGGGAMRAIGAAPGAALAAPSGAISADGRRVYFTEAGSLYLGELPAEGASCGIPCATAILVAEGAEFQAASEDGSVAFYTKEGHLYRYAAGGASTDLTPSGGVKGVLGISASGSVAYYQDASGLERWAAGTTSQVAAGAEAAMPSDYPPATATARVSADGSVLAFLSTESETLSGYDNTDQSTHEADSQVYLYSVGAGLSCVSCDPSGERPTGPATIPGAEPNGPLRAYKPRALSAGGRRLFFDSPDRLVPLDSNGAPDAYEWEAGGEGTCAKAGGCVSLISSGTAPRGASFADASASGADAFFLTEASLEDTGGKATSLAGNADPGAVDLYDAREGGGFPAPQGGPPCLADACEPIPAEPEDPTPNTLLASPGNLPAPKPSKAHCAKHKRRVKRHGRYRCVRIRHRHHTRHHKRRHGGRKHKRGHGRRHRGRAHRRGRR